MNRSPCSLVLLILLVPLTGLGQSYEWFDRIESTPGSIPSVPVRTEFFQVAASEHGIYAVGRAECNQWPICYGYLVKYRAEDGKLLWQRKFSVFTRTSAFTLHVNQFGVFVGGRSADPPANIDGHSFVRLFSHEGDTLWTTRDSQRMHDTWEFEGDDDSLYICGDHYSGSAVLRRVNFDGKVLWTRTLGSNTNGCAYIEYADGRVYLWARPVPPYTNRDSRVYIIQASDGALLGNFDVDFLQFWNGMAYHDGALYLLDYHKLVKYSVDGSEVWRLLLERRENGLADPISMVVAEDGLLVAGSLVWPQTDENGVPTIRSGHALIKVDFDGNVADVTEFPGHWVRPDSMVIHDGAVYATGGMAVYDAYTARYSDKPLVRPSLVSLAGATPEMPPRLAMLSHEYGAGPMRVGIRDAAPGSPEYRFEFSEGLKPVSFDKVADLNGNGYEELVVMSRLPALAEVRDSLDGSLVSTIKLESHLEPLQATVEQREGTPPRLAVVSRNRNNDKLLLRIYNLETGSLLATNSYHPGFDPVDLAALPDAAGSGARRYALLARNRIAGEPNKVEIRGGDGSLLENLWLGRNRDPLQLAVTGAGVDGLSVLRYAAGSNDLDVLRIDLGTSAQQRLRFSAKLTPVAMLELPDINGNGAPQYAVYGEETGGEPVKAETRDLATGALDHNVFTGKFYRPENAAYVGPVPGFSDEAFALLGFRHENGEFRASLADVDGTKLFDLTFFTNP